jgi:hypothetical protein
VLPARAYGASAIWSVGRDEPLGAGEATAFWFWKLHAYVGGIGSLDEVAGLRARSPFAKAVASVFQPTGRVVERPTLPVDRASLAPLATVLGLTVEELFTDVPEAQRSSLSALAAKVLAERRRERGQ